MTHIVTLRQTKDNYSFFGQGGVNQEKCIGISKGSHNRDVPGISNDVETVTSRFNRSVTIFYFITLNIMSTGIKRTIVEICVQSVNKGVLRVTDSRDVVTDIYHVM